MLFPSAEVINSERLMCLQHIFSGISWCDQSAVVKDSKAGTQNEIQTTTATFVEIMQSFL